MVPQLLSGWTIDTLNALLMRNAFEDDRYDLKAQLPPAKESEAKGRLRKSCAAFANSGGGFLVFGVSDEKNLSVEERLVGLSPTLDFPEHFGAHAREISPSINWHFLNPPIVLPSRNLVHVVWIPKSWRAPHATKSKEDAWVFPKRTNKGNEFMTMDEIRSSFLGQYEKRLKLQLLRAELSTLARQAQDLIDIGSSSSSYSIVSFDTRIVESVLSDTYSVTATHTHFQQSVSLLREQVGAANNAMRIFFSVVNLPMSGKTNLIVKHNAKMKSWGSEIKRLAELSLKYLDEVLRA